MENTVQISGPQAMTIPMTIVVKGEKLVMR